MQKRGHRASHTGHEGGVGGGATPPSGKSNNRTTTGKRTGRCIPGLKYPLFGFLIVLLCATISVLYIQPEDFSPAPEENHTRTANGFRAHRPPPNRSSYSSAGYLVDLTCRNKVGIPRDIARVFPFVNCTVFQRLVSAASAIMGNDEDDSAAAVQRSQLQNRIREEWAQLCTDTDVKHKLARTSASAMAADVCAPHAAAVRQYLTEMSERRGRGELPLQRALSMLREKASDRTAKAARYQLRFLELLVEHAGEDLAAAMFDPAALASLTQETSELATNTGADREAAFLKIPREPRTDGWPSYQRWRWGSRLTRMSRVDAHDELRFLTNFTSAAEVLYEGKRNVASGLARVLLDTEMIAMHDLVVGDVDENDASKTIGWRAVAREAFEDALRRIHTNYALQLLRVVEVARLYTEKEKSSGVGKAVFDVVESVKNNMEDSVIERLLECALLANDATRYGPRTRAATVDWRQASLFSSPSEQFGGFGHTMDPAHYFDVPHNLLIRILADLDFSAPRSISGWAAAHHGAGDPRAVFLARTNDLLFHYLTMSALENANTTGTSGLCARSDTETVHEAVADLVASPLRLPQNWAYWMQLSTVMPTAYMTPSVACSSLSRGDANSESARYICNQEYLLYASPDVASWFTGNREDLLLQRDTKMDNGHRIISIGGENKFQWEVNLLDQFNMYRPPKAARALHRRAHRRAGEPAEPALELYVPPESAADASVPATHKIVQANVFDCTVSPWHPWLSLYKDGGLDDMHYYGEGHMVEVPRPLFLHNVSVGLSSVCGTGVTGDYLIVLPRHPSRLFVTIRDLKAYVETSCNREHDTGVTVDEAADVTMFKKYPPLYLPDPPFEMARGAASATRESPCATAPAHPLLDKTTLSADKELPPAFDGITFFKYDTEGEEFFMTDSWYLHEHAVMHRDSADVRRMETALRDSGVPPSVVSFLEPLPVRGILEKTFYSLSSVMQEYHLGTSKVIGNLLASDSFFAWRSEDYQGGTRIKLGGTSGNLYNTASTVRHFSLMTSLGLLGMSTEMNPFGWDCCIEVTHTHYSYFTRSEVWMALKRYHEGNEDARMSRLAAAPAMADIRPTDRATALRMFHAFVLETGASAVGPRWVEALYDEGMAARFANDPLPFVAMLKKAGSPDRMPNKASDVLLKLRGFFSVAMWGLLHDEELAAMYVRLGFADADGGASVPESDAVLARQRTAFVSGVRKVIRGFTGTLRNAAQPFVERLYYEHLDSVKGAKLWERDVGFTVDPAHRAAHLFPWLGGTPRAAVAPWGRNVSMNYGDEVLGMLADVRASDTAEHINERLRAAMSGSLDSDAEEEVSELATGTREEPQRRLVRRPLRIFLDPYYDSAVEVIMKGVPESMQHAFTFMQSLQCGEMLPMEDATTLCNPRYALSASARVDRWLSGQPDSQREKDDDAALNSFPHHVMFLTTPETAVHFENRPALERLFTDYEHFVKQRRLRSVTGGKDDQTANRLEGVTGQSLPAQTVCRHGVACASKDGEEETDFVSGALRRTKAYDHVTSQIPQTGTELSVGSSFDAALLVQLSPAALRMDVAVGWMLNDMAHRRRFDSSSSSSSRFANVFPRSSHVTFYSTGRSNRPTYMTDEALPLYALGYLPLSVHVTGEDYQKVDMAHYRYFIKSEVWAAAH